MSDPVRNYYDDNAVQEWDRLALPRGQFEFACTQYLIDKYFPAQGHVCDIGGGPGRYTIELIRRGYQVTLFELSEEEVKLARVHLDELGLSANKLMVGDARDLSALGSSTFDAALLMGPMYHIVDPDQRLHGLHELARIIKPLGVAIVSYLNSWGIMRSGIVDFPHWYEDISVLRSMQNEQVFSADKLSNFTECYWSTPPSAHAELECAGLEILSYAGADGFASGMGPLLERLASERPHAYANVVQVAAETCELPQYRDATDHLHFVVRSSPQA